MAEKNIETKYKALDIKKIVSNNFQFDKIKMNGCNELFEYFKENGISCAPTFIDGYYFFKFYTKEGIIIVPENSYILIDISAKSLVVRYNS